MIALFLLLLLGVITYFIVQRVKGVTRTPSWLLWLVAMAPAFIWTGWAIVVGTNQPMPSQLLVIPFVTCLILYWLLIQWGRVAPPSPKSATSSVSQPATDLVKEPPSAATSPRPLDRTEEKNLQTCFPWSVYYLQTIECRGQAVICRGQLRSKPEVAYQTIRRNIEEKFGDRFYVVFQEAPNGKPVFVLLPNPDSRHPGEGVVIEVEEPLTEKLARPRLAIGLLAITFLTCTLGWLQITQQLNRLSPALFLQGVPYAAALLAILAVHEMAHYLTAQRYQVRSTLPYFIPVIPLPFFPFGTFGAFMQIRSPMPHRRALFDVGIAGPLGGFIVALPLLFWGLTQSQLVPLPPRPDLFNLQALDPSFSLLLTLLSKLALGSRLTADQALKLHPVAVAGCLGLVVTALNLMPVGQLDGGHIVHAMFGQRIGTVIGQISRFLLLGFALVQSHLMAWAIFLFLISASDEPALNDITELDDRRDFLGLLALGLLLLIVLPTPAFISGWLNV